MGIQNFATNFLHPRKGKTMIMFSEIAEQEMLNVIGAFTFSHFLKHGKNVEMRMKSHQQYGSTYRLSVNF